MRALRNGHTRRNEVTIYRTAVADVDLLDGSDVPMHMPMHHDRLGENLRHDLAVGTDGQHVLPQLDGPFDEPIDGHVFAGTQGSLDDNALANVGVVFAGGWADGTGVVAGGHRRGGTGRSRRTYGLIFFPHEGQYTAGVLR